MEPNPNCQPPRDGASPADRLSDLVARVHPDLWLVATLIAAVVPWFSRSI